VNSIIARNGNGMSHFDCYDTAGFTYVGVNIADDPSCGQHAGIVVLDPRLELPANNGGPTLTVGLSPQSGAINAGSSCSVATDQRFVPRDGQCDIGAFEFTDFTAVTITIDPTTTVGTTGSAVVYARTKLRLGEIDSADVWLARALRDTTQGAGQFDSYLAALQAELRLQQSRLPEARVAVAKLPDNRRGQRATAAMLRARLRYAEGDKRGAAASLEGELGALLSDGKQSLTLFALPLVTAGEWRLASGDAPGADSLARLARTAAAIDSIALMRSGLAGQAELLLARALRARGQTVDARRSAERAVTALANGYGRGNAWTLAARALVDSLPR
jgi:hypothetical protein